MNPKEAVQTAKSHVTELFQDEQITALGLEEVEFDEPQRQWKITVGFARPWDRLTGVAAMVGDVKPGRSYKVVSIRDDDGQVISIKNR